MSPLAEFTNVNFPEKKVKGDSRLLEDYAQTVIMTGDPRALDPLYLTGSPGRERERLHHVDSW